MIFSRFFRIYLEFYFVGDYVVDEAMIGDSGKLAVLDQMLKHLIEHGHRVSWHFKHLFHIKSDFLNIYFIF